MGRVDQAIGLIERLSACFTDGRDPELIEHTMPTPLMQRMVGVALGYEDLNDHDPLRFDPVWAVLAGKLEARRKRCAPLAGKSTLNRWEHAPSGEPGRYHKIGHDAGAIEALFIERFLDAYPTPPEELVLDLDVPDNPLPGHQEGRFFQGYDDSYGYLPLSIFCGRHVLAAQLARRISTPVPGRWRGSRAWSGRFAAGGRRSASSYAPTAGLLVML